MVLFLGVHFAERRTVKLALESFYGVGENVSARLMARHYIHPTETMGGLENRKILDLTAELTEMRIENDLRRQVRANIARLRDMKAYRGLRHAMNITVRGQRTRNQIITAIKLNHIERKG